ncbi:peptidylprolyl isomerase [Carboxylicivirga linearis]|uniref:Periplasmic chaperone PpiD n=1 Tax=Carboxylicivirga linearis TaxID=1628157 RepID=A0ABS5JZT6_9BACT|nr:peptidylprolyl isomerase [Carboxylicivirga linearis]MBS2100325.1 SurA N-terminal domain-containing protein [Carboxylicivirga linearis]
MATLEKIRSKAGLVIVVIGVGMAAFLLGDLMNSGGSMFRSSKMEIAEINGTTVSLPEYQAYLTELEDYYKLNSRSSAMDENTSYQIREQAWNQMVQDVIMNEKYEDLGIHVTSDEIFDMATGKNVHPQIRQMFTNPQTGMFDKQQVINFLRQKDADPSAQFFWMFLEKQIKNERLMKKYSDLISKGMYVTTAQAKAEAEAKKAVVDFDFIVKRYATIPDSTITVSDSEIKDYYNSNIENYKQDATREVEYVSFEVKPSDEDKEATLEWIKNAKAEFSNPETDAVQYVKMNSETEHVERNWKIEQLSSKLQDFVSGAQVGEVYGPYQEGETYKLTRLVDVKQIPDSVKARHILLKDPTVADSLFNLVKGGANFAEIARANSEDPGSAINGGDLGWFNEGTMVKPFNDACFNGKKGDIVKVQSQFGTHIINIQDKGKPVTKYNIATLDRKVAYSSKTNQQVYAQAAKFASQNKTYEKFNESIQSENLIKRYGRNIRKTDRNVSNMDGSREMIRWAFEADIHDMSDIFEFGDEYVIGFLTGIKEEGYQTLASVKSSIERQLRNKKKADMIIADLKSKKQGNDLNALASATNTEVQSASDITFASYQVPGAGVEPALVAVATTTKEGEVSTPVAGNNGVFVVKVTTVTTEETNVEAAKSQLAQTSSYKAYQAYQVIRENASIDDNRIKFY